MEVEESIRGRNGYGKNTIKNKLLKILYIHIYYILKFYYIYYILSMYYIKCIYQMHTLNKYIFVCSQYIYNTIIHCYCIINNTINNIILFILYC